MLFVALSPVASAFVPAMDTTLTGAAGERLGYQLAAADFDGDGYDDLAVGCFSHVVVFRGSAQGLDPAVAWTGGDWGEIVALDANGDGYDDLVVPTANGVALYLGSAAGLSGASAWTYRVLAYPLLAAGDVNGDGRDDLVLADPQDLSGVGASNLVLVFHGTAAGLVAQPSRTLSGNTDFGYDVGVTDIDGDGYADVAVGNPFAGVRGTVKLYRGGAAGTAAAAAWTVNGAAGTTEFGREFAYGGDLNGDGFQDLAVVASGVGLQKQFARVLGGAGGPGGALMDPHAFGVEMTVAIVPDTASDGMDELVVGWESAVYQGVTKGGAGLFRSGTAAPTVPDLAIGSASGDRAGSAVAGGDFDGNGFTDWAVGARHVNSNDGAVGVNYDPR